MTYSGFDQSDEHPGVPDQEEPYAKPYLGAEPLIAYVIYDTHLAAFLMERGQKLADSFLREGVVNFQFESRHACLPLEKEWRYGEPSVPIKSWLVHLNALRDLVRVHKGNLKR